MSEPKLKPVLLDTSVLISFLRGEEDSLRQQVLFLIKQDRAAISVITRAELFYKPDTKLNHSNINVFKLYDLEIEISKKFIELIHGYSNRSAKWIPDALIAATALYHGLELYTLNTRDFNFIRGLRLYKPRDLRA